MGLEWAHRKPATTPEISKVPATLEKPAEPQDDTQMAIRIPEGIVPKPDKEPIHIDVAFLPHPYSDNPNQRYHEQIRERRIRNND